MAEDTVRASSEEMLDAKLLDDLIEEENRAIIAGGGPRKLTEKEQTNAAKKIAEYKKNHQSDIEETNAWFKTIQDLEIPPYQDN